jgi:hypothetical protein
MLRRGCDVWEPVADARVRARLASWWGAVVDEGKGPGSVVMSAEI